MKTDNNVVKQGLNQKEKVDPTNRQKHNKTNQVAQEKKIPASGKFTIV